MEKLLKKHTLSIKEAQDLDYYLDKDVHDTCYSMDNKIIISAIKKIEDVLEYSCFKLSLQHLLYQETIDAKFSFYEEDLEQYEKYHELIYTLNLDDCGLAYCLGDYYLDKDKQKAIYYYESIFKKGFDLSSYGYYESLNRYLKSLEKSPVPYLIDLIENTPKTKKEDWNNDYLNTFLLLIINLKKSDPRYIEYINKGIDIAYKMVKIYQDAHNPKWDYSDEEKNLCELLALKFEYYVINKEYVKAFEQYNILTTEIASSNCTRYYHARDKFYYDMLKIMSEEYPELVFFENFRAKKLEIQEDVKDINNYLNKSITLKDEEGKNFKFIIKYINNDYINIVPILPLIGEGGSIFRLLKKENQKLYLIDY